METNMGFENNLRKIAPYIPGEQPKDVSKVIKLNTNENPYPAAPGAEEIACNLRDDKMRLYPPTDAGKLSKAIAKYYGVPEKNTFVGPGPDTHSTICHGPGYPRQSGSRL